MWPGGETEALTRIERHLERKVGTAAVAGLWSQKAEWMTFSRSAVGGVLSDAAPVFIGCGWGRLKTFNITIEETCIHLFQ